jgi:hypothetical protein
VLALREWSTAMAGTNVETHRAFWDQAKAFRRRLVGFLTAT